MNAQRRKTTLQRMLEDFGTQAALADEFGVSKGLVSMWMSGKRGVGVSTAQRIDEQSQGKYRAEDLAFGR